AVFLLRITRRNSDIVEQAEAHAGIGRGMMAGRTHDAERVLCFPAGHRIHGIQHAADGLQRYFERARADLGVAGAQGCQAMGYVAPDDLDVLAAVAERELVLARRARPDAQRILDRSLALQRMQHGVAALRTLRMPVSGPMLLIYGIRQDGCRGLHAVRPWPGFCPAPGTPSSTGPDPWHRSRSPARGSRDNPPSPAPPSPLSNPHRLRGAGRNGPARRGSTACSL